MHVELPSSPKKHDSIQYNLFSILVDVTSKILLSYYLGHNEENSLVRLFLFYRVIHDILMLKA